jgi:hypothetical protein
VNGKPLWGQHSSCGSDTLVRQAAHIRKGDTAGKGTASAEPLEGKDGRFRRLREMDYLDSEGQCHANRGL